MARERGENLISQAVDQGERHSSALPPAAAWGVFPDTLKHVLMINLACQFDGAWNHQGNKSLGVFVTASLIVLTEVGNPSSIQAELVQKLLSEGSKGRGPMAWIAVCSQMLP